MDCFFLGITIVIGGQYFSWNASLAAGLGSSLFACIVITIGYGLFAFSMAEIYSTFPVSGGAFGLARVTLGFLPGYIIGICEALEYITYVATSVIALSGMLNQLIPSMEQWMCLVFFQGGFYLISVLIYTFVPRRAFWYFIAFLAIISMVMEAIFIFGSMPFVDFNANGLGAGNTKWMLGGMEEILYILPIPIWLYVGFESIAMTGEILFFCIF